MENYQFEQYGDASNVRTLKFRSSYGTKISKVLVYGSNEFGEMSPKALVNFYLKSHNDLCAREFRP